MSDKLLKKEEKEKKLLKRDETIPTTTVDGQAFGNIDVRTIMVDKPSIETIIDEKLVTVYKPGGSKTAAQITSALLVAGNEGKVYNASEYFTTTADFVEGAGTTYPAGTNIVVINTAEAGQTAAYKFDVLGGMDKNVVRGLTLAGDEILSTLTPSSDGIINIPYATLSAQGGGLPGMPLPGVVYIYDGIDGGYDDQEQSWLDESKGNAATPKAVYDAITSAKNYTDAVVSAKSYTYTLSNSISTNHTQVLTFTETLEGTATPHYIELSAATDVDLGLVKLTDDYTTTSGLLSDKIAITPSGVLQAQSDAITSAYTYTDNAISALTASYSGNSNQTITAIDQTNGKISAVYTDIEIAESQVTGLVSDLSGINSDISAVSSVVDTLSGDLYGLSGNFITHGHGYIDHNGILRSQNSTELSAGDPQASKVVITDASGNIVAGEYDGTYNASTNKFATQSTVSSAISGSLSALDYTATEMGAGKTISTLTEEDGLISATFRDIAITESQVTDLYTKVKDALSASTFSTRPTTVNGTIDLLMALITALKGLAPASNTPEEP